MRARLLAWLRGRTEQLLTRLAYDFNRDWSWAGMWDVDLTDDE